MSFAFCAIVGQIKGVGDDFKWGLDMLFKVWGGLVVKRDNIKNIYVDNSNRLVVDLEGGESFTSTIQENEDVAKSLVDAILYHYWEQVDKHGQAKNPG